MLIFALLHLSEMLLKFGFDFRFIVQTAAVKGGIIVTRDNYRDLLSENPAWAETIKYR